MIENCIAGKHNLMEIYRDDSFIGDRVVRWCAICGCVVVDYDYDGRTNVGGIMKMISPELFDKERE